VTAALGLPPDPGTVRTLDRVPQAWTPPRLDAERGQPVPTPREAGDIYGIRPEASRASGEADAGGGFGEVMVDAIRSVDAQAKDAGRRAEDLAAGRSYDVHGTMIALERSGIATRLLANVRNRAIEAYREIMRMGA